MNWQKVFDQIFDIIKINISLDKNIPYPIIHNSIDVIFQYFIYLYYRSIVLIDISIREIAGMTVPFSSWLPNTVLNLF